MAQEDYRKALRLGQKEFRSSVLKGTYPYLQALDEILEHTAVEYTEPLGVVNIPLASIVGTKTAGRKTAFAGNFMPLLDEDTEFAQKWNAQCTQCIIVHLRAQAFQIHRTAVSHTHAAARRDHLVGQFQPQHLSSILPTPMADALRVEHQSVHIK